MRQLRFLCFGEEFSLLGHGSQELRCQLLVAAQLQVLVVEPLAFLEVELRARLAHALQRELRDEFVHCVHLLVSGVVPSEQGKEVYHRFGVVSALAIAARHAAVFLIVELEREHGETESVSVAFAEFAVAIGLEQQWQVSESGHCIFPPEGAIEQHMQGCTRQPLLAADDMTHLHEMVVHNVREVVGRQVVRTLVKHLIV